MGLGAVGPDAVTLADAREMASDARRILVRGEDPLAARQAARDEAKAAAGRAVSFGAFADDFVATHQDGWKNPKHRAQWASTLSDRYIADLRKKAVADITTDDVLSAIKPLWGDKRETASRIRQRIERVIDAAVVAGKRPHGLNPAAWKGHLALLLPKHGKRSKGHHAAMPWAEVPDFMAALSDREGVAARAVEFTILTAARSGEVRGAVWGEVDLEARIWTIPAEKMKADRPHRVPLSAPAVSAVKTMLPLRPRRPEDVPGALVFPGLRKRPMSDMTLGAVLKRMKVEGATVHGFRSSFRDWAGEATDAPFEVAEMALAQAVGDATVQAYLRADLFERRRKLMDGWARFLGREAPTAD